MFQQITVQPGGAFLSVRVGLMNDGPCWGSLKEDRHIRNDKAYLGFFTSDGLLFRSDIQVTAHEDDEK